MKIRALCSFSGRITMTKGETKECGNEYVVQDLLKAGYVEAVDTPLPEKTPVEASKEEKKKTTRKKKAVSKNEDQ